MISLTPHELGDLLFFTDDMSLDEPRAWAMRHITDFHSSECRVISAALALAVKDADPNADILYVQVAGPENKFYILWRAPDWKRSRHRAFMLRTRLGADRAASNALREYTQEELAYRKICADWLARVASEFCTLAPGYKISWTRDSMLKLASKANYDLTRLFDVLIDMLDEDLLRQVWVAAPYRKTNKDKSNE